MNRRTIDTASRRPGRRRFLRGICVAFVGLTASRMPILTARDQPTVRDQSRSIAALEKRGGRIFRDGTRPDVQPVIGVNLDETEVNDAALAELEAFPHLQQITLDDTPITDAGLAHLEPLTELEDLSMDHTAIGDAGLAHLRMPRNLRKLSLVHTAVTDAALKSPGHDHVAILSEQVLAAPLRGQPGGRRSAPRL